MYKDKKILAIIPARGGSKGIPKKNIIDLLGKPLLYYSIKGAKESKYIDEIVVSTDDKEIAEVTESLGIDVPFLRPKELSQDNSKSIDAFIHSIKEIEKLGKRYDYILLLQNTSPLRQSWHIDEAIEKLLESDERSLVSVSEVTEHPCIMRTLDEKGNTLPLISMTGDMRRQDFPPIYIVNGAIYIQKNDEQLNLNTNLNGGKLAYVMEREYSVDIDEYLDLEIATHYLKRMKEENL
ncbi:acylneuraminate cytidylyltransferase family protein [Cetobacterium sp.]|uniref:acylneuraminate cytidylyltransferase family protein n=1 Tax=Cetobacterium sp. TaxID=2071632 RepID=UPI003F409FE3